MSRWKRLVRRTDIRRLCELGYFFPCPIPHIFFTFEVGHLLKKEYIYSWKIELRKLIAMPSDLESSIRFLEETNDPTEAFFTYTVDETGEFGLIKANKEGLRLYAAELLRKSQALEQEQK